MRFFSIVLFPAILLATLARTQSSLPSGMASLVEAERAFAKLSVAEGRRAAFLAFFSDEGLLFTPQPAKARELIRGWPAASSATLDWEPRFGDVARAADLGYTTGPYVKTSPDARILSTGWFFTIWKVQPDGSWKVLIDSGVTSPAAGPLRPATFEMAPADGRLGASAPDGPAGPHDTLAASARSVAASPLAADRALCASVAENGTALAFEEVLTEATRLYREGLAPVSGLPAIRSHLAASKAWATVCLPIKQEMSRSADLGYTYGQYASGDADSGYYLRVWKRWAGEWKLAIDLLVPRS